MHEEAVIRLPFGQPPVCFHYIRVAERKSTSSRYRLADT